MKKTYNVDSTYNNMRIDRWVRNNIGNIPQGFIEKSLRNGKIKINRKKIKSSHKVKTNDQINLYNFDFEATTIALKELLKNKNVKAVVVYDTSVEQVFVSAVRKDGDVL